MFNPEMSQKAPQTTESLVKRYTDVVFTYDAERDNNNVGAEAFYANYLQSIVDAILFVRTQYNSQEYKEKILAKDSGTRAAVLEILVAELAPKLGAIVEEQTGKKLSEIQPKSHGK